MSINRRRESRLARPRCKPGTSPCAGTVWRVASIPPAVRQVQPSEAIDLASSIIAHVIEPMAFDLEDYARPRLDHDAATLKGRRNIPGIKRRYLRTG